ncbi:synaptic plasticity regulator PANTS isoform X2 [Hydra vulgaris]|uniref:Synaptic plasticity regulator PANTS n=1 Tax=Hydra vulgaris TaxID=6087 RepID=A0ABM4CP95_HYDVU
MEESDVENKENREKILSCVDFYDIWRRCSSISSQFHRYYQYGEFSPCIREKKNFKSCLWYKVSKTPELKAELIAETKEIDDFLNFVHKPSSSVWEFRENPAADWLKKE